MYFVPAVTVVVATAPDAPVTSIDLNCLPASIPDISMVTVAPAAAVALSIVTVAVPPTTAALFIA